MIDILIIAAGEARRFGAAKQLASIDGVAMLRRVALQALGADSRVTVVLGAQSDEVAGCIDDLDVSVVHHADWSAGMGSSIAAGVASVAARMPRTTGIVVALADQPLVAAGDFLRMIDAHRKAPSRIIAADHGDGVVGAPVLFPDSFLDELIELGGVSGARSILQCHASEVDTLAMPTARIDIDTPADLAALMAHSKITLG